jgi:hypothetical protein
MTDIVLNDLTTAALDGDGVFDVLMRANKAHLESEFTKGRIKGTEYSTVYLGALNAVMSTALQFIMSREKINLESKLLEQQVILAEIEVIKANAIVEQTRAQTALLSQQVLNATAELEIIKANALKIPAEILQTEAQTRLINQQNTNLVDHLQTEIAQRAQITQETLNLVKQGTLLDQQNTNLMDALQTSIAQRAHITQQTTNLAIEAIGLTEKNAQVRVQTEAITAQITQTHAQTDQLSKQTENLIATNAQIKAQTAHVNQETTNLAVTKLDIEAHTSLVNQQSSNAVIEGTVLTAQKCKLQAEYDMTLGLTLKGAQETSLLAQKTATERAQTTALGVDVDSVLGSQKALYKAQATGFTRDAEQKAAKIMVDSWNVRRTTDEGTVADSVNMLNDAAVGRAVNKLMAGVGA